MHDDVTAPKKRGRKPGAAKSAAVVQGLRVVAGTDALGAARALPLAKGQSRNADGLTARMERFAVDVAKGSTLAAAYRVAYTTENMLPETIWNNASRLMSDSRVQARVDALVVAGEAMKLHDVGKTRLDVMHKLYASMSDSRVPPAVQLRAAELLGKTAAMFTDRVEQGASDADQGADAVQDALEARLAKLLKAG